MVGAWWATVHGIAKSRTQLSNFTSPHFTSSLLNLPPTFLPNPTPLGCYRAPAWVPWVIQQIPIGFPLKGTTEDEMAGWHHRLDGREFEWNPGVGDRQGGLACCNSWGLKESDMTEQLNWTELNVCFHVTLSIHPSLSFLLPCQPCP